MSADHPAIVSVALARALYGRDDVIGRKLRSAARPSDTVYTVIGVVEDVPGETIAGGPARMLYVPVLEDLARTPTADAPISYYPHEMTLVVRSDLAPSAVVASARRILRELDPKVPIAHVRTLEQIVDSATSRQRLTALLLLVAAGASLVLGAVGVYGVISYAVSQRAAEFGIRLALGATPRALRRMIVRQGLAVAVVGIGAGLALSVAIMQGLRAVLYQVSPTDPVAFVSMTGMLLGLSLLASYLPARRASEADPTSALRAG